MPSKGPFLTIPERGSGSNRRWKKAAGSPSAPSKDIQDTGAFGDRLKHTRERSAASPPALPDTQKGARSQGWNTGLPVSFWKKILRGDAQP